MEITIEQVKELRDLTGISIMKCREALKEAEGDLEKAKEILRSQGSKVAEKKANRELNAGSVATYVHDGGNRGAMIELLCETDFVSKNQEFKDLAREIAMQITAMGEEEITEQTYIRNPEQTIGGLLEEAILKFGEKIEIGKVARFSI